MTSEEIRRKFLDFFAKRGHAIVPSSSLVPENDPSVLFTTAGMQQFKPFYIGKENAQEKFGSLNTVSIQKCIRTSDIDEVGDDSHLTFFEMLGNFSFGGYWKKEAIQYAHEFITKDLGLEIDYVSVFRDDESNVPPDVESKEIWQSIDPQIKIKEHNKEDNFWGPTGDEGPCGPTTEIYINGVEIWNIVFNEYYQNREGELRPLDLKGIDTGMGLERLAMVSQNVKTVFETDLFSDITALLPESIDQKKRRIFADHMRAISFIIDAGVTPSNKGTGYVLRRLLRRLLAQFETDQINQGLKIISGNFDELDEKLILDAISKEWLQFSQALESGRREMEKLKSINAESAFKLYESYGLPFDVIKEKFPDLDIGNFNKEFEKHQEISRAGMSEKFKGGLGGHSEMEIKYHTATHLLHQALHDVLGDKVEQKGSNITPERLRFDFSFERKMTEDEKKEVEKLVNQKIQELLPVKKEIMPKERALEFGARHSFLDKYPDEVTVYFIGESLENAYSKEFCGGPHVENTGVLGNFKIIKEEAVSTGVRRIKAVLE